MDYFFDTTKMPKQDAGGDYSTANGPFVKGKKIIFGKFTIPSGTRAETHSHPNEQFIFPLQGKARMTIKGKTKTVIPGDIVFIPANTPHSSVVVGNEDLIFVTAKDTSWGIVGIKKNVKKSPSKKK